jgi:hypothetical protein
MLGQKLAKIGRAISPGNYVTRFFTAVSWLPIPFWARKAIIILVTAVAWGLYLEILFHIAWLFGAGDPRFNGWPFIVGFGVSFLNDLGKATVLPLWRDWRAWRRKRRQRRNRTRERHAKERDNQMIGDSHDG